MTSLATAAKPLPASPPRSLDGGCFGYVSRVTDVASQGVAGGGEQGAGHRDMIRTAFTEQAATFEDPRSTSPSSPGCRGCSTSLSPAPTVCVSTCRGHWRGRESDGLPRGERARSGHHSRDGAGRGAAGTAGGCGRDVRPRRRDCSAGPVRRVQSRAVAVLPAPPR